MIYNRALCQIVKALQAASPTELQNYILIFWSRNARTNFNKIE